ncbi:unannotated protein [freshwater metagenome]|jgi:orotidine-5'-phosphate decarboxylase|uniref:Orotidine 5'-phosphate decarboxylase n=1 Tax=freshwater metagenome TaxID=449393 RepID=A0A6J6VYR4_9ZZZZ|nr:orotidine-5'-phosphate decarboxylase [Actinomycetota bacterium]MSV86615.1 orotidine-5'-phosphate decarboxylase [Actinomycetota bacterium]MSW68088.1 orotidine-5'-phosphate decarboxylase [Actinomycetota bacterium]MSY03590.1 orotidine-5'-phosphate decarboxylase [Actinomycetota bacterium]MSY21148.1 orotidine-5'-phosphate decarboxylase [Actinomycetota bacterium]
MSKPPIILALDTPNLELAQRWVECTGDYISAYKLGLEFFLTHGAEGVRQIQNNTDLDLFLDLKLHDIPNTVAKAALQVAELSPRFLTVHASGGSAMIEKAVTAVPDSAITAVTILTSLSEDDLKEIGFERSALDSAVGLAILAVKAGARAIVCSPLEIAAIANEISENVLIITPGVRALEDVGKDDQSRVMTPRKALEAGADLLVIGRPITGFWEKGEAAMRERARAIAGELS